LVYKAEIGDFLYIIIFAVLMLLGGLEKVMKAKRQQNMPPQPPQPDDDFEDVESSDAEQAPPQTLEEIMRRMMQTVETQNQSGELFFPEKAQPAKVSPEKRYSDYQPAAKEATNQIEQEAFAHDIGTISVGDDCDFEFDIRQAVIASEILNRKY